MKNTSLLITLIFAISTFSYGQKDVDFDLGTIEDNEYYNDYFGIKLSLPNGWSCEIDEEQKIAKKAIEDLDESLSDGPIRIDIDEVELAFLLTASRYSEDYAPSFNYNLIMMVERIENKPYSYTGKQYLESSMKLLKYSTPGIRVKKKVEEHYLGGKIFHAMNSKFRLYGMKIRQKMFATVLDDFVLGILLTYQSKEHLAHLESILQTLEIGND